MRSMHYYLLTVPLLIAMTAAHADPANMVPPDKATMLVEQGKIISLDNLLEQHPFLASSRILDLELEYDEDREFIYEIQSIGSDGYITEYEFDATTGSLIQEEFQE